ncbi:MAG TPA: MmcQ/YjbR family DNA-binding protein [Streptosporangiaceae bacterium]|nr:MmcQ/YjbR family DNA-binding protein [Streptosporangiaceae bacterium]
MGARLGTGQDWDEIAELIEDSYRLIAPERLAAFAGRAAAEPWQR